MSATVRPGSDPAKPISDNIRVLLVEDEETLGRALARFLTGVGFEVELATNGATATERLMSATFDVIVSDIHVPGATGVDILRTIRSYALDVPMILMTGDPSIETAIEAVNLGAMKYLVKPVDGKALAKDVSSAANLHRLAKLKRDALEITGEGKDEMPGDMAGLSARFTRALDEMWIAFQPIVHLEGDRLYGYEALLRSREPSLPGPLDVVAAAERLGAIEKLGARVRELALSSFGRVKDDSMSLFLNLHPTELLDASLYEAEGRTMELASRIVLEVTERSAIEAIHDVQARTSVLRFHGYRLAVDDLGAGYAGLTSFVTLEPEIVKLDMSLVRDVHTSRAKQHVIGAVVKLCREMGLIVVAEGIETREELEAIRKLRCHLVQGYYLGKPAAL